jgi:hypothetical protein
VRTSLEDPIERYDFLARLDRPLRGLRRGRDLGDASMEFDRELGAYPLLQLLRQVVAEGSPHLGGPEISR